MGKLTCLYQNVLWNALKKPSPKLLCCTETYCETGLNPHCYKWVDPYHDIEPEEASGIQTVNKMPSYSVHFKSSRRESPFKITTLEKFWTLATVSTFQSTFVTLIMIPFSHRIIKSHWQNRQFPILFLSLLAYKRLKKSYDESRF